MIKDREGNERFFVSQKYLDMLNRIKDKINNEDQEFWIAYVAKNAATGVGKSLRAMRDKYIINPDGNIEEVCFSKEEFINTVLDAKKGDVIICDEAISIFFSRGSMTKEGRLVAEISNQIRQKNLCIMLCVPEVLSLDWLIQKKLNCVVIIWEDRKNQGDKRTTIKGCCAIYPEIPGMPLKSLFINYQRRKKTNPMLSTKPPQPFFREPGDSITKKPWYPFGEDAYRKKKESVLEKYRTKPEDTTLKDAKAAEMVEKEKETHPTEREIKEKIIYDLRTNKKYAFAAISRMLDIPSSTIRDYYARFTRKISERGGVADNVVNNSATKDNILEKEKINNISFNINDH